MRTLEQFKRMLSIIYVYAAKLIQPSRTKQLPAAQTYLRIETKAEE